MNIVFVTELPLWIFEGAESIRIMELSKSMTYNSDNKVFVTSLIGNNDNQQFKRIFENSEIYLRGNELKDNRNFFSKVYFSFKRKQNELRKIYNGFLSEKENTIFIIYSHLATFYDEYFTIRELKKNGFKTILDKCESNLGIILNQTRTWSAKDIFFRLIKIIDLLNGLLLDELVRFYDGIIVISSYLEQFVKKRGVMKFIKIPILYPEVNTPQKNDSKKEIINVGYFGTITFKRDQVLNILEAIKLLKFKYNENFILSITGKGTKKIIIKLEKYIEKNSLQNNVIYHGFVSKGDLYELQKNQDILIVLRNKSLQGKASFATKLANYMHLGKLVIASAISDNEKYIKDGENGFIISNNKPLTIAKKLLEIKEYDITVIKNISENARKTALDNFCYRNYTDKINKFLSNL